ncbi:MAG TPA: WYL domain-containing protein [Pyrinomonadaceae bacterium]|nr:WYL domain-containing protein [Pyrinomonadaceae bacterium]HMP66998.1 WYL domain-containing protein [Pyrinomonadaceae bacterium]
MARLQRIHREISAGRHPSLGVLAEILDVTPRTVKRDIAVMRNLLSAPVKYDRRQRGFIFEEPGWTLPVQKMTEGEMLAFFLAERVLRFIGHSNEAVLVKSATAKLAAHLPEEVSVSLSELLGAVSYQGVPASTVKPATLSRLARACIESEILEIEYYSPHSQKLSRRTIEPYCLHNFAGDWYLIAFDHLRKGMRDFQLSRIREYTATGRWFTKPANWDSNKYLADGFQMTRGGRPVSVEIVFDSFQAQWIRERRNFHPNEEREELENGELKLSFRIGKNGLSAVARFCMTYAGHFRVIKPNELRSLIRQKAGDTLKAHK